MNVIIPINSDNPNWSIIQQFVKIYSGCHIHLVVMGYNSEAIRGKFTSEFKSVSIINGEDYNFSRAIAKCISFSKPLIGSEEFACISNQNYAFSFLQIEPQLKNINIDMDKSYISLDIYEDKSRLQKIDPYNERVMHQSLLRIKSLETSSKFEVVDHICVSKFYRLLEVITKLDVERNNFNYSDIKEYLNKIGLVEVKSRRAGLKILDSVQETKVVYKPIPPEVILRRAVEKTERYGVPLNLKPDILSSLKDNSNKGIIITFPETLSIDKDRYFGDESQWITLIKLLDKTKFVKVYILGNYPWNINSIKNLESTYIISDEQIRGIEEDHKVEYCILNSDLTFGFSYKNKYLEMSNNLGTPTLFYGWNVGEVPNTKNTKSEGIKLIGNRFEPSEVYSKIRNSVGL